ncbi:MAG: UDP-forming cellulose synthase catalytic subunit, partial [Thiomonas sp.]
RLIPRHPSALTVGWWVLAFVWLYLAWIPVSISSQAVLAWGLVGVLLVLRRFAGRAALLRLLFLCLAALVTARYLIWRATSTLGFDDPLSLIAGMLLFAAELYGVTVYGLGLFINMLPLRRASLPLPADQSTWPTVDVFVPSYNEDPEILETTLLAALNMRYAPGKLRVYLLDDGGTDQKRNDPDPRKAAAAQQRHDTLQALCARIGAHYLTRERNEHAKAGNINSALQNTHGDLVVIFDADHVPTVDFLQRTVGAFVADPKLFLVQTPHFFINPDPLEHNWKVFGRIPSENEMFYNVIQHGLDFWEASFFCGSAAVLRRAALMEVGGVSGDSITEDAETALSLHARGWKSAYINHPMIAGLQPETYSGFITQRVRWAQGMLQILLLKNPLTVKGLHWWQRLAYFNSAFFWFFPFARVAFMLAPSAYLIFGLHIYNANLAQFFAYALPHVVAAVLASDYLFGRVRWAFVSELYELTQSLYALSGLIRVLRSPRSPSFLVTPKGEQRDEEFISELATPFYWLLLLGLVSMGFGVWRWFSDPSTRDTTLITMAWELFNLVLLSGVMGVLLERRQRRSAPRMPIQTEAVIIDPQGRRTAARFADLSATGCRLALSSPDLLPPHAALMLEVFIPALRRQARLHLRLAWQRGKNIGAAFEPADLDEKRLVVALAYGDSERWVAFRRHREAMARSIPSAAWFLIRHGATGMVQHFRQLSLVAWHQALRWAAQGLSFLRRALVHRWQLTRAWILDQPLS